MSASSLRFPRLIQKISGPVLLLAAWLLTLTSVFGHGGLHERLAQLAAELEKNPNDARLYFELADVNCQHGEWQASLLNLDRVDELAPGKFLTSLLRGDAWLTGAQPQKAKEALDSLLVAHPECARGWLLRARAAQRLGDGPASIAGYREALARTAVWEPDLGAGDGGRTGRARTHQ